MRAPRPPKRLDELPLQVPFAHESLALRLPSDVGPLHQQDVDVPGRIGDGLSVRIDQQGVGIERAVVDQMGSHAERSDLHPRPVLDEARSGERAAVPDVRGRRRHDPVRRLADVAGTSGRMCRARP